MDAQTLQSPIASVAPEASAAACARLMSDAGTDCLLVTQETELCGILTGHDLIKRALAEDRPEAHASELMSAPVITTPLTSSVYDVFDTMLEHAVSHVVVVPEAHVEVSYTGIISVHDILLHLSPTAHFLSEALECLRTLSAPVLLTAD